MIPILVYQALLNHTKLWREQVLTEIEAYRAIIKFLDGYYQRGKSDDIAVLLGGMSLLKNGRTADSAMWEDWLEAVENIQSHDNT